MKSNNYHFSKNKINKFFIVLKISILGIFDLPCALFLNIIGISFISLFSLFILYIVSIKKLYPLELIKLKSKFFFLIRLKPLNDEVNSLQLIFKKYLKTLFPTT